MTDKSMYKDMWVFIEHDGREISPVSLELLCEVRKLCDRSGDRLAAVLAGAAVVVAGGLSLLASAFPDGLEWSLQRLTGSTELETTGPVQAFFARIQEWTALLPDYNFAGSDAAAGTSAAGIIGAVVVLAVVILGVKLVKKAVHRRGSSAQGH